MKTQYENKALVDLNSISEEARGILVKASTFAYMSDYEKTNNKEFMKLYEDFQAETNNRYLTKENDEVGGSFSRFMVAAIRMNRLLGKLYYKNENNAQYEKKDSLPLDCMEK